MNIYLKLKNKNLKFDQGYVALITMLIIGAVGLSIAVSLLLLSTSSARTSFAYEQSSQARNLANACAQEGLQRIKIDSNFTGTRNLTLGDGSCIFTVNNTGGTTREILVTGTVGTIISRAKITISSISPKIIINSWQEIAEF